MTYNNNDHIDKKETHKRDPHRPRNHDETRGEAKDKNQEETEERKPKRQPCLWCGGAKKAKNIPQVDGCCNEYCADSFAWWTLHYQSVPIAEKKYNRPRSTPLQEGP